MKKFLRKLLGKTEGRIKITAEPHPKDTPNIMYHRVEINKKLEDLLNRTMSVKLDEDLSPEEKYAIIMSSFISTKKIVDQMMNTDKLFAEKEYKKLRKDVDREMNSKPSYFG